MSGDLLGTREGDEGIRVDHSNVVEEWCVDGRILVEQG